MIIKKYTEFLKEELEAETDLPENTIDENEESEESESFSKYQEVIDEIKRLIEETINKNGGEFNQFILSLVKDPENVKIEGLINESDIYDFYLKYRNQVDEVLNTTKFYQQTPDENGCLGLYEYVIFGTNQSIIEFVKLMSK